MNGRELTREQTLQWRETWSWDDRRLIEANLDRLQAMSFDLRPSGGVVRCRDATGRAAMYIAPGYLQFAPGCQPNTIAKGDWRGLELSTFRPWHGTAANPEWAHKSCPVHGYPLLPSGLCDSCEEELL